MTESCGCGLFACLLVLDWVGGLDSGFGCWVVMLAYFEYFCLELRAGISVRERRGCGMCDFCVDEYVCAVPVDLRVPVGSERVLLKGMICLGSGWV